MFKICKLTLYGYSEENPYIYEFSEGINYFKGKNDSGKTEFYTFIDYMFGSDINLKNVVWYKDSLSHADVTFSVNDLVFVATRYICNKNQNYLRYADEEAGEVIRLDEYRERLNAIFAQDSDFLKDLRNFVGEDVSFRTFTLFNFLGEQGQGALQDFFDKCRRIEYKLKLPAILNFIFNNNLEKIAELKQREATLASQLAELERASMQNTELRARVNSKLAILGIKKVYTGYNGSDIMVEINRLQSELYRDDSPYKTRTIEELEAVYTSIDEQIKRQKSFDQDYKSFEIKSKKQKALLNTLTQIIEDIPSYRYLVNPIVKLTSDLDRSISFNKYLIQEDTIKALKKQRELVKKQILASESRYKIYSVSEKAQAITLVKDYIGFYNASIGDDDIKNIQKQLKEIRKEIRLLQNSDDDKKLKELSNDITRLYGCSSGVSDIAENDFSKDGFQIRYIKSGNILQPQIEEKSEAGKTHVNYYTGSMARHTLMQLCGYLAFLRMLIIDGRYPIIPILVVDHISKPFDHTNEQAIGQVLHGAYENLGIEKLQIIIFDDENANDLSITPNKSENLVTEIKGGFNPFYFKNNGELINTDTTETANGQI